MKFDNEQRQKRVKQQLQCTDRSHTRVQIYIMGNIPAVTTDGLLQQNQNGGFYQPSRMYHLLRKFGVGQTYLQLWQLSFPTRPTASELARESNVEWEYADKVIWESHLC
jgi:hypothetical protein